MEDDEIVDLEQVGSVLFPEIVSLCQQHGGIVLIVPDLDGMPVELLIELNTDDEDSQDETVPTATTIH